jgi:predicted membrane metal-binding protein
MRKEKVMKKRIIKSCITIALAIIFSMPWIMDGQKIIMKILGFSNGYFISYMLVEVFSSMQKLSLNKRKISRNINLSCLLWAITFFLLNTIKYGTIMKLLNILAVFVIGTSIYDLVRLYRNKNKEVDCIEIGYIWIGFVLLIPVVLILVLIGY